MNQQKYIIVAELSPSPGTTLLFKKLFGINFELTKEEYSTHFMSKDVTVRYLNLSQVIDKVGYAQNFEASIKYEDVENIFLFEHFYRSLKQFPRNFEILKKVFNDQNGFFDKLVFIFNTTQKEFKKRAELVQLLNIHYQARSISNFPEKVFSLNDCDLFNVSNENKLMLKRKFSIKIWSLLAKSIRIVVTLTIIILLFAISAKIKLLKASHSGLCSFFNKVLWINERFIRIKLPEKVTTAYLSLLNWKNQITEKAQSLVFELPKVSNHINKLRDLVYKFFDVDE